MDENEAEAVKKREEKIVNSLCSFQNRLGPPEYRRWRRVHGLQLPLHPQQVVGWVVLLTVAAATFLVLIPSLSTSFRDSLLVVLSVLFGVHVISHVAALLLDPADPELRALKVKVVVPQFDRTKRAHVIENGHCYLCNINIKGPRTKHCSVCNKCIDKFDHHCKWLNHCIGGRNYAAFFICVVTAVVASLLVVGISVLEIVYYHTDPDLLDIFPERFNATTSSFAVEEPVFLGVVYILAFLAATTAGLLLHLCLFHCYISLLGITTYEYIRSYRQGAVVSTTLFPYNFSCKKLEVMSNHLSSSDQAQKNRRGFKFDSGCCYSRSRPPEDEDHDPARPVYMCEDFRARFKRCESNSDEAESPKKKVRKLERQDTDPEFVDRVVKPFVITLGDEKKVEAAEGGVSYCCAINPAKHHCCSRPKNNTDVMAGVEDSDKIPESHAESIQTVLKIGRTDSISSSRSKEESRMGKFWQLCLEKTGKSPQLRNGDAVSKIKCNQIRPKSEEEINKTFEKIVSMKSEDRADVFNSKLSPSTDELNKLPELRGPARKLQNSSELKEITTVLDFAEQPNFALQRSMRSNLRRGRKKIFSRRPRSPSLSPIRESGLSNPGSPRVNTVSPPSTPILARTSSPEMSTIFLSNPNSPCSSDEDSSSPSPTPRWTGRSSGNILETPQLPRKIYAPKDPVFMVKPNRFRSSTWADIESREGV